MYNSSFEWIKYLIGVLSVMLVIRLLIELYRWVYENGVWIAEQLSLQLLYFTMICAFIGLVKGLFDLYRWYRFRQSRAGRFEIRQNHLLRIHRQVNHQTMLLDTKIVEIEELLARFRQPESAYARRISHRMKALQDQRNRWQEKLCEIEMQLESLHDQSLAAHIEHELNDLPGIEIDDDKFVPADGWKNDEEMI